MFNETGWSTDPRLVEETAFYGAIELLMPKELVEVDAIPLMNKGWTHMQLVHKYKVPLKIVELRLSSKPDPFNSFYAGQKSGRHFSPTAHGW